MDLLLGSTGDSCPLTSDGTIDWGMFACVSTLQSAPSGGGQVEGPSLDDFVCSL